MSVLSSRTPYTERDRRASIIPTETQDTTAHSSKSRSPPNPTTSIPQRKEEDSPPYNTRGSGWGREGSSQPADPSRTKPYGPYSSTDTTRPLQHKVPYSHASQVHGSLGLGASHRPESKLKPIWWRNGVTSLGWSAYWPSTRMVRVSAPSCVFPPSLHYNF
jgi:hypothetical protein